MCCVQLQACLSALIETTVKLLFKLLKFGCNTPSVFPSSTNFSLFHISCAALQVCRGSARTLRWWLVSSPTDFGGFVGPSSRPPFWRYKYFCHKHAYMQKETFISFFIDVFIVELKYKIIISSIISLSIVSNKFLKFFKPSCLFSGHLVVEPLPVEGHDLPGLHLPHLVHGPGLAHGHLLCHLDPHHVCH